MLRDLKLLTLTYLLYAILWVVQAFFEIVFDNGMTKYDGMAAGACLWLIYQWADKNFWTGK